MNVSSHRWTVLVIGGLSAMAALFGPSEPWGGVDVGATGAASFMLALGAAIWFFAVRAESVFPEHMSVSERRSWVGLILLAVILAAFLREMWALSTQALLPTSIDDLFARRFIERYLVIVIAWAVMSHLIGRRDGGVESDERDLRLQRRADRAGDVALTLIVINAIAVLVLLPRNLLGWWLEPIVLANVLVGLLIAKSLVEHLTLAYLYRFSSDFSAGRA